MSEAYIETYTGKKFPILNPDESLIDIEDIAHALSNQCRWTGHIRFFMSVAEHSVLVSQYSGHLYALEGLLHDASEAYLSDISRPIKQLTALGPPYLEIEKKLMEAIVRKFGLSEAMPVSVRKADNYLLWVERAQLMHNACSLNKGDWEVAPPKQSPCPEFSIPKIGGYFPRAAENMFLDRFEQLTKSLKAVN